MPPFFRSSPRARAGLQELTMVLYNSAKCRWAREKLGLALPCSQLASAAGARTGRAPSRSIVISTSHTCICITPNQPCSCRQASRRPLAACVELRRSRVGPQPSSWRSASSRRPHSRRTSLQRSGRQAPSPPSLPPSGAARLAPPPGLHPRQAHQPRGRPPVAAVVAAQQRQQQQPQGGQNQMWMTPEKRSRQQRQQQGDRHLQTLPSRQTRRSRGQRGMQEVLGSRLGSTR